MVTTKQRWIIEAKVAAATAVSAGVGIVLAVLNDVQADSSMLGSAPGWEQTALLVFGPTCATFLAGYLAKHTPRPPAVQAAPVPPTSPTNAPGA